MGPRAFTSGARSRGWTLEPPRVLLSCLLRGLGCPVLPPTLGLWPPATSPTPTSTWPSREFSLAPVARVGF